MTKRRHVLIGILLNASSRREKALSTPDDKNTIRKESISIAITTHGVDGDSTQSIFQGIRSISSECRKKTKSQLRSVTKIRPEESCVRHQRTREVLTLFCSPRGKIVKRRVEYLAEEDRVNAWKLHKEIYTTSGKYKDDQLKFYRFRRHGNPEYISRPTTSVVE